jgi:hypothetical protein
VAQFAYSHGIIDQPPTYNLVSDDNYWFPDIGDALESFRSRMSDAAVAAVARFSDLPRNKRRVAKKAIQPKFRNRLVDAAIPEIAAKYGLRPDDFRNSISLLMRGRISSNEASKRLFAAIQRPTSFVHVYFKQYDGPKDLPEMIRGPGETMSEALQKMKNQLSVLPTDLVRAVMPHMIKDWGPKFAQTLLELVDGNEGEYGLDASSLSVVKALPTAAKEIPSCTTMAAVLPSYVEQILGFRGPPAKIERSFGGDLMHALYLQHVDIWRGDARFCELIRQSKIGTKARVVSRLSDLPKAILH